MDYAQGAYKVVEKLMRIQTLALRKILYVCSSNKCILARAVISFTAYSGIRAELH